MRMATLAPGGRISVEEVEEEVERLRLSWDSMKAAAGAANTDQLERCLDKEKLESLDLFDRMQLAGVLEICSRSRTLSEAGRALFSTSRNLKTTTNDADRLRKYLARFGLNWQQLHSSENQ